MTATLPLHRWRIIGSLGLSHHRPGGRQPVHGDCPWFWTTIEANPTARAVLASVAHGMYTIAAQLRCQEQAFGRAGLHAQPASLTFLDTDHHLSPRSPCHIYLVTLRLQAADVAAISSFRSIRKARHGTADERFQSAPSPSPGWTSRAGTPRRTP